MGDSWFYEKNIAANSFVVEDCSNQVEITCAQIYQRAPIPALYQKLNGLVKSKISDDCKVVFLQPVKPRETTTKYGSDARAKYSEPTFRRVSAAITKITPYEALEVNLNLFNKIFIFCVGSRFRIRIGRNPYRTPLIRSHIQQFFSCH